MILGIENNFLLVMNYFLIFNDDSILFVETFLIYKSRYTYVYFYVTKLYIPGLSNRSPFWIF